MGTRRRWRCIINGHQFSVTTGTRLHHSHIPLATWMRAAALLCTREQRTPATVLAQELGLSYKTGLHVLGLLHQAMAAALAGVRLGPIIQATEIPWKGQRVAFAMTTAGQMRLGLNVRFEPWLGNIMAEKAVWIGLLEAGEQALRPVWRWLENPRHARQAYLDELCWTWSRGPDLQANLQSLFSYLLERPSDGAV
jgi:hypothetical protein